jgi:hypothetical protein
MKGFLLDLLKRICTQIGNRPAHSDRIGCDNPEIALPATVFPTVAHRLIHSLHNLKACIKKQANNR